MVEPARRRNKREGLGEAAFHGPYPEFRPGFFVRRIVAILLSVIVYRPFGYDRPGTTITLKSTNDETVRPERPVHRSPGLSTWRMIRRVEGPPQLAVSDTMGTFQIGQPHRFSFIVSHCDVCREFPFEVPFQATHFRVILITQPYEDLRSSPGRTTVSRPFRPKGKQY
jgi:hypothetical protein